jgi:hypothetical protein
MNRLMEPLENDEEIGPLYSTYGGRIWREIMREILDGAAGTPLDGGARMSLIDGQTIRSDRYVGRYLKAVRDTIHSFDPKVVKDVFGLHKGVLPLSLSQLAVMLWLRLLVDPTDVIRPFRS